MKTIASLLQKNKSSKVLPCVDMKMSVLSVLAFMSEKDFDAVLVMEREQIKGMFSEKDYARYVLINENSSLLTPVSQVMQPHVLYVTPHYSYEECLALMTRRKIRHLPVIEHGQLLDVINMSDVAAGIIENQAFQMQELTKYVTGTTILKVGPPLPQNVRELVWTPPSIPPRQNPDPVAG